MSRIPHFLDNRLIDGNAYNISIGTPDESECGDGLQTVGGTTDNSDGHFVREQQKGIPKVSYRALNARDKKVTMTEGSTF
jgi:hypothetical protein